MSELHFVSGDLFENLDLFDGIGHGVNCKGVMGGGIAVEFRERWPEMYQEYKSLCEDEELLPGDIFAWKDERTGLYIYNMATQFGMGPTKRGNPPARYEWLEACLQKFFIDIDDNRIKKVAMPLIGSGLGGLDAAEVREIIAVMAQRLWTDDEGNSWMGSDSVEMFVFDTYVPAGAMEIEETIAFQC